MFDAHVQPEEEHMRINTAKQMMQAGRPAFGWALGSGAPAVAEALATTAIDFIMLDGQHGSFGPSGDGMIECFRAMAAGSAIPMARVARNDFTLIGKLLDEGAMGIVVPMVHTPEEAKAAANACRFPPRGTRSWGYGRAATYGDDYTDWIDDQVFVAVQIESIQAVENAEAIMATPGVDGMWLGPADLALSMGIHPRDMATDDRHARAVERALQACKNTGTAPGYAGASPEQALELAARGFQFLTAGSDLGFLVGGARQGLRKLEAGH
jgi:4-hydroxy-2-oxoheptanedioate aldolase